MSRIVYSSWDSGVFGFTVATMEIPEDQYFKEQDIAEEAKAFDVVFVRTKRWVDFVFPPYGLDHLYDMELVSKKIPKEMVFECIFGETIAIAPNASHLEIARKSFPDSRFRTDPELRKRASEMYAKWVSSADRVFAIEGDEQSAFLVKKDEAAAYRISLVAVDERYRGHGVGERLIGGMLRLHPGTWRVKVSVRNHRAIRFYEKLGFRIKDPWTVFHIWPKHYGRV